MSDFKLYRIAKVGTQEVTHGGECDSFEGYVSWATKQRVSCTEEGEFYSDKELALKCVKTCNDVEQDPEVRYELETINCEIEDEE